MKIALLDDGDIVAMSPFIGTVTLATTHTGGSAGYPANWVARFSGTSGVPIWSRAFDDTPYPGQSTSPNVTAFLDMALGADRNVSFVGSMANVLGLGLGPMTAYGYSDMVFGRFKP